MRKKAIIAPDEVIQDAYVQWLLDKVQCKEADKLLLLHLHLIEYYAFIDSDQSRADDGRELRTQFEKESCFINYDSLEGPCSLLEFLLGLAYRMDFFCTPPEAQPQAHLYFWNFIDNLSLLQFPNDINEIDLRIDRFLERKFASNGTGGLFPLIHPKQNQKSTDIWHQMSEYIGENPNLYLILRREERWTSIE